MKLTLEITDDELSDLKRALQVDYVDYNTAPSMVGNSESTRDYVGRILWARKILKLSTNEQDACFNPPPVKPFSWDDVYPITPGKP